MLQSQLIHGIATRQGTRNRHQVRDGQRDIEKLQPTFLWVMLTNHRENWGEVSYDFFVGNVGNYGGWPFWKSESIRSINKKYNTDLSKSEHPLDSVLAVR